MHANLSCHRTGSQAAWSILTASLLQVICIPHRHRNPVSVWNACDLQEGPRQDAPSAACEQCPRKRRVCRCHYYYLTSPQAGALLTCAHRRRQPACSQSRQAVVKLPEQHASRKRLMQIVADAALMWGPARRQRARVRGQRRGGGPGGAVFAGRHARAAVLRRGLPARRARRHRRPHRRHRAQRAALGQAGARARRQPGLVLWARV